MQEIIIDINATIVPLKRLDLFKGAIPSKIFEHELLNDDGLFILEHSKNNNFNEHPFFKEQRKYGAVHFSFFEKSDTTE